VENENRTPAVYSKTIRAGRRRTYFFDVRTTRGNDYFVTITESKKRFHEDGYDRHKVFLYKEDFNKFLDALNDVVSHVKTDLLPEYDFDEFSRKYEEGGDQFGEQHSEKKEATPTSIEPKSEDSESAEKPSEKPEEAPSETPEDAPAETPPPAVDDEDLKM